VYLLKTGTETSRLKRKVQMQNPKFYRGLLTISAVAIFWSAPALVRAAELNPLVVTGIPLDKVAAVHPTPEIPRTAFALGVDGKVVIKMTLQNGHIVEAKTLSGNPMLGYSAKKWILRNWKFKPEISGVFTIPINYKRQA
jgi:outer membrane biosynthesis protein TonB